MATVSCFLAYASGKLYNYVQPISRDSNVNKLPYIILLIVCVSIVVGILTYDLFVELRGAEDVIAKKIAYRKFLKTGIGYTIFTLFCLFLFTRILLHGYVPSGSMIPTLQIGEHLAINGLAYQFGNEPERGDIIVFNNEELDETLVKRCIGLPGDVITFEAGKVYVNGERLDESEYLSDDVETYSFRTFEVPEGCYFFLGDNRTSSLDARYWVNPYISKDDLVGKVFWHFCFAKQQK